MSSVKRFFLLVTFSFKKNLLMLTEIWPAYSNEIHGTWRETKSFNRLGEKNTTCHESDRSIQKQGIEFIKSTDDDGMWSSWWEWGKSKSSQLQSCDSCCYQISETLCTKLETFHFLWELSVNDITAFKIQCRYMLLIFFNFLKPHYKLIQWSNP